MTFATYTIIEQYGSKRAKFVDPEIQQAVEELTGAKQLTRRVANALCRLGFILEYVGDIGYDDDPIYPHGQHLSQAVLDTIRANGRG